jgi:hypothetical protein
LVWGEIPAKRTNEHSSQKYSQNHSEVY